MAKAVLHLRMSPPETQIAARYWRGESDAGVVPLSESGWAKHTEEVLRDVRRGTRREIGDEANSHDDLRSVVVDQGASESTDLAMRQFRIS